ERQAERTRRHLDAWRLLHDGVSLELTAEFPESHEVFDREVARLRHRRVDHRRGVALADDETVPIGPGRVLRVVPHYAEVKRGRDIDGREGASRVTGVGVGGNFVDVPPEAMRYGL